MNTIGFLILGVIFLSIIIAGIIEHVQYLKYKSQLKPGTKLRTTMYTDDEFDSGHVFTITILEVGKKQVKVQFSDGSISTRYISTIMDDGFKII